MKNYLIALLLISSINLIIGDSIKWKVEFVGEDDPEVKTSFNVNKGSYLRLFLSIIKKNQDYPPRAFGKLQIVDSPEAPKNLRPFILSNEITIDTNELRQYSLYLGMTCNSDIQPNVFKVQFKIDSVNNDLIEWPELNISVIGTPVTFRVKSIMNPINSNSFAPYYIENSNNLRILNVDNLSIKFPSVTGGTQNKGVIEDFTVGPFEVDERSIIELKGYYSGGLFESETIEFSATIESENNCFKPIENKFTWKVSNVNLPLIHESDPLEIAKIAEEVKGNANTAQFNLYILTYPLQISCGATSRNDYTFLDETTVTDQNNFVYKYHFDLLYFQTFVTNEGNVPVIFKNANRYASHYQTVCYLQTIKNTDGKKDFSDTLKITFGMQKNDNWRMLIKAEEPAPAQCVIWTFEQNMKSVLFGEKVVEYCHNYFGGKDNDLKANGCLMCEERAPDYFTNLQKSICMRSSVNCPTIFEGNIKEEFAKFINTIDTKEKIESVLKLTVSIVININHSSDKDEINEAFIQTNIIDLSSTEVVLKTLSQNQQTLSCLIKDLNTEHYSTVTEANFKTEHTRTITLIPGEPLEYEVEYSTETGYDSTIYNVVLMCYNLPQYQYHLYHTDPVLSVSILKTDKKPVIDDIVPLEDCSRNPKAPECLPYDYRSSGVNTLRYSSDLPNELIDFKSLTPGYKTIKIEEEIVKLEKLKDNEAINNKIILVGELLSNTDCRLRPNYKKCREFKSQSLNPLINKLDELYHTDLVLQFDINAEKNVPILSYMLFAISNNVESFNDVSSINNLLKFTHVVIDQYKALTELIKKRDIEEKEKSQSLNDFYTFLVLHHVNLFEAYRFLEADKKIEPMKDIQLINSSELKQIKEDFEALLKLMPETSVTTFKYDNIFILYTQGLQSANSDKVTFAFSDIAKISIEPKDLFEKIKELKLVQMFYFEKHPFISINAKDFNPHTVSLRLIGNSNANWDQSLIDPSPEIYFNVTNSSVKFNNGFEINMKNLSFTSAESKLTNFTKDQTVYSLLSVNKIGDYTIGVQPSKSTNWLWLIIVCSVVGVTVIGAIVYLILRLAKKKKSEESLESIKPLLNNESNKY